MTYDNFKTVIFETESLLNPVVQQVLQSSRQKALVNAKSVHHKRIIHLCATCKIQFNNACNLRVLESNETADAPRLEASCKRVLTDVDERINQDAAALKIDNIELILNELRPLGEWPLGRVVETSPERGGIVRLVNVKIGLTARTPARKQPCTHFC